MLIRYADPVYHGCERYYQRAADYQGPMELSPILSRLQEADGWALSLSEPMLPAAVSLLAGVDGWSVAAWIRGARPSATGAHRALSGWEPVIYSPARRVLREAPPVDVLGVHAPKVKRRAPLAGTDEPVIGAKPIAFAPWLFALVDARPGDRFDDLYPGSGVISAAWAAYTGGVS